MSKTVNGVKTEYAWDGNALIAQKVGGKTLIFLYDATGLYGFRYEGNTYFYLYNGQGDVMGLVNTQGAQVVSYTYDAWGKPLATIGTLADTVGAVNPIRYRGYYYDAETGFYYVSSRYYDPEIGRWINVDSALAGVGESVQGYNLFVYCFNNPVNMSDETGAWPSWNDVGNFFKGVGNKIVDGAKSVGKFLSDTFGAQTTTTVVEREIREEKNLIYFTVSKTDSVSYEIEKGTSKTVTAYADTTNKKVGIKVNAGNVSGNIGAGLDGLLSEKASIKIQETTYSFGYKEKVIFGDYSFSITNGNYTQTYTLELNKINLAAAVAAPYLIPMGAGGKLIQVFG